MHNTLPQHIPALDGLRAVAALGIVVTHVSFQTATGWAWAERLDYFVAVFFALSAFVLWRRRRRDTRGYYLSRIRRLAPAYLVCVGATLALLPGASFSAAQVVANLTATQIYVPDGLAAGLTQLWSLCVEFAFYAVLPLLGRAADRFGTWRLLAVLVPASLTWAWWVDGIEAINAQIFPPAYVAWFAVGIAAAELEPRVRIGRPWPWFAVAAAMVWLASREWFGPRGLTHPQPHEFALRILAGAVFALCIVWPVALGARHNLAQRFLASPPMLALGRWSYSLFLWHVAVLWVVFPLTGIRVFSGHFFVVLALTVVLSFIVAAVSYEWVERPFHARPLAPVDSAASTAAPRAAPTAAPKAAPHSAASSQESPA